MSMVKERTLKDKLIFTILMLVVYRIGISIPLPFVDGKAFKTGLEIAGADNLIYAMTMMGGAISSLGLLGLGVMPYITASIIMQLMKVVIPRLEEMYKTEEGRKKTTQYSRYLTLVLAVLQSLGLVLGAPAMMGFEVFTSNSVLARVVAIFAMVVGAIIAMRIGEEITLRGISNGTSLLIFTSILSSLPNLIVTSHSSKGIFIAILFVLVIGLVQALVVYVEKCEYPVRVIYAKNSSRGQVQGSKLPIKVALAGVLPVIFASSLMSFPSILQAFTQANWVTTLARWFEHGTALYSIVFLALTVFFTFFSVMIVFDVDQLTTQVRSQGGFIEGKRPGEETQDYLSYLANKMAGLDAIYLVGITMVTVFLLPVLGIPGNAFGSTSIIILCTVVVTLLAAIEAEKITKTTTTGFLTSTNKTGKKKGFNPFKTFKKKDKDPEITGFLS